MTSHYASHATSFAISAGSFLLIKRVSRPWVGSNIIDFTFSTSETFFSSSNVPTCKSRFFSTFLCRKWGGPISGGGGGESSAYRPNPLIFDLNVSVVCP